MAGTDTSRTHADTNGGLMFEVYHCQRCAGTTIVLDSSETAPQCHGEPMVCVETIDHFVDRSELSLTLEQVAGIPQSGSDICYALLIEEAGSVEAVANSADLECSTVREHLNRLVGGSFLDRTVLPREGGGTVAVYHPADGARQRPRTLIQFCRWAAHAAGKPVSEARLDIPLKTVSDVLRARVE